MPKNNLLLYRNKYIIFINSIFTYRSTCPIARTYHNQKKYKINTQDQEKVQWLIVYVFPMILILIVN
jgi:hypothetical protein